MRRMWMVVVLLALVLGCKEQDVKEAVPPGANIGAGMIHRGVGPECPDTWHIATPDGKMYWPVEDPKFQVDGMNVQFVVREKTGAMSTCMAGTIVTVLAIKPVESAQ